MSAKYSKQYKIVGQTIQKYRKLKGYTQEELAEKTYISTSYLSKIEAENCDKSFSLEVLFDFANALNVHVRTLLENL